MKLLRCVDGQVKHLVGYQREVDVDKGELTISSRGEFLKADGSSVSPSSEQINIYSDEGLTLETSVITLITK